MDTIMIVRAGLSVADAAATDTVYVMCPVDADLEAAAAPVAAVFAVVARTVRIFELRHLPRSVFT